jgi:hypothetical protein
VVIGPYNGDEDAEELNRGLDLATAVAATGEQRTHAAVSEQYNRNVAKVGHILDDKPDRLGGKTLFEVAGAALFRLDRSKTKPATQ